MGLRAAEEDEVTLWLAPCDGPTSSVKFVRLGKDRWEPRLKRKLASIWRAHIMKEPEDILSMDKQVNIHVPNYVRSLTEYACRGPNLRPANATASLAHWPAMCGLVWTAHTLSSGGASRR